MIKLSKMAHFFVTSLVRSRGVPSSYTLVANRARASDCTHFRKFYKKNSGATMIDVLIAIVVLVIISAIVVQSFSKYRKEQTFKTTVENVVSLFNEARSKTLLSYNSSSYGVHVESGRVVLFKGTSFTEPSSDNREITLDSRLSIASISFTGGGANVVFDRLTGATTNDGSFIIRITSDTSTQKTVTVTKTGIVSTN